MKDKNIYSLVSRSMLSRYVKIIKVKGYLENITIKFLSKRTTKRILGWKVISAKK